MIGSERKDTGIPACAGTRGWVRGAALAILALVSGCAARAPSLEGVPLAQTQALPESYGALAAPATPRAASDIAQWWRRFGDPALVRLAEATLAANQDVAQAAARLARAEARHGAAGAARLPTLDVSLDASRPLGRSRPVLSGAATLGWDPDLFGRLESAQAAAKAELAAAGYDLAAVQRAAVAETARSYLEYRALGARIANAEEALTTQRAILDVIRHRFDSGIAPAVDVEQARLQMLQVEALIPQLTDARGRAANRIAVLIGKPPGDLGGLLDGPGAIPVADALPPAGVPADLLRKRPDVMAAEQRVLAAAADAGSARADLYPRFTLGGLISASAFSLPSLVDAAVTSLVGGISHTLFDGGQGRAVLRERRAATREALAAYRAAILTAMEDVANALSAVRSTSERVRISLAARDAARRNAELARGQYDIGLIDFFILLDAEQQLLGQRDELIAAQLDRADAAINLYVALGGGW
jgi:NodT family efflux transporter outer membrane factor (OMF) lipoprotein